MKTLLVLGGLAFVAASGGAAQCVDPASPGALKPQPASLGLQVSGTLTAQAQWSSARGACAFVVSWWPQGQAPGSGSQSPQLAATQTSWTGTSTLSAGYYVVRLSAWYTNGTSGYQDATLAIPPSTGCTPPNSATTAVMSNGRCEIGNKPLGAACSPPTGGSADGAGNCVATPVCTAPNSAVIATIVNGRCAYANKPVGAACSPPIGGTADGAGNCVAVPACTPPNGAMIATLVNGKCAYANKPAGAVCSPPAGGHADGAGHCVAPPAPPPSPPAYGRRRATGS